MKGLRSSAFFAILSLVTVLMIGKAYGQMSQQEAINHVQQYLEAGVIHNIYVLILEKDKINVTVGNHFHEMKPAEKLGFCQVLSFAYPWTIIEVTDVSTDDLIYDLLGSPPR